MQALYSRVSVPQTSRRQSLRTSRRQCVTIVRAEGSDEPKLDFKSNTRSALGFTENDSAGQTNIFAVEPKSYVQGSQSDATSDAGTSTTGGAAIAGSVAVGAVVAGLILLSGDSDVVDGPEAGLKSLTAYKNQFAGEIVAQAPAPVAVVEAAPEVVGD